MKTIMIYLAVRESKYPKVTRRRELAMIKDIVEVFDAIGYRVSPTRNIMHLPKCNAAFFRPDYYKDLDLVRIYNKCQFEGVRIIVGGGI